MKEKIEKLFVEYEMFFKGKEKEQAFSDSQMIRVDVAKKWTDKNCFFPCGYGVYSDNLKNDCKVMVLGNDWGMDKDFYKKKDYASTINPLLNKLKLNTEYTFFTNFYMGLRNSEKYSFRQTDTINHSKKFKEYCFDFFKKQLKTMKPKIVLCLGRKVKAVLSDKVGQFPNTNFVFIPHSSYHHISWKNLDIEEVKKSLR